MRALFKSFLACERGATSIEYAMIAGGISIVVVAAVTGIGSNLRANYFGAVSDGLK